MQFYNYTPQITTKKQSLTEKSKAVLAHIL